MKLFKKLFLIIAFGIIVIVACINVIGFNRSVHVVNLNFNSKNFYMNKGAAETLVEDTPKDVVSKKGLSFRVHGDDSNSNMELLNIEKGDASTKTKDFDEEERNIMTNNKPVETGNKTDRVVSRGVPLCSKNDMNLVGAIFIDESVPKSLADVEKELSSAHGGTVLKGGCWAPTKCAPKHKVAIIIPYRKRVLQLKMFLRHMHPFLQKQLLDYRIFLVEHLDRDPFNRAALFNVGFVEALKLDKRFDCFVFTDVDLLPEDDRNFYDCPTSPRHMSVAVDKFHYQLPYATIFGGAGAFLRDDFEKLNGFSNLYFGWGGEDDDLYKRMTSYDIELSRPPKKIGRYKMVQSGHHQSSKQDPNVISLLQTAEQRMVVDGLNSLKYNLRAVIEAPLVTVVRVKLTKDMYT